MEFKGTQGEWSFMKMDHTNSNQTYIVLSDNGDTVCRIMRDDNDNSEVEEANVKMISKSKEMFSCIGDLLAELRYHGFNNSTSIYQAEQLLKEVITLEKDKYDGQII